jgi:hypothetical protein
MDEGRDTNGLRKFAKERSSACGTGGGNRSRRSKSAGRLGDGSLLVRCAKCSAPRFMHERSIGQLVPDHDFVPPIATEEKHK